VTGSKIENFVSERTVGYLTLHTMIVIMKNGMESLSFDF
jgi:hypothetical protein